MEDKRQEYQTSSTLHCVPQLCSLNNAHCYEPSFLPADLGFSLLLAVFFVLRVYFLLVYVGLVVIVPV